MKKIFLLCSLLVAGIVSGQISITYSDYSTAFGVGAKYMSYTTPIGGPLLSVFVGEPSADAQYWDFTGYTFEYVAFSAGIEPANAPLIDSFPTSNLVLYEKAWLDKADTFYMWNYKELTADKFMIHGTSDETSVLLRYDPPAIHAVVPLEFGSSWQRERDSTFIMEGFWIITEGNVIVDAFGTMKLPSGEYQCLRLTQNHLTINHYPGGVDTAMTRSYHFYSKDVNEVNLSAILDDQFNLTTITISGFKYSQREGSSGLPEMTNGSEAVSLGQNYPNPFTDQTLIPYQVNTNGHVELTIVDVMGNTVATLVNTLQRPGLYEAPFVSSDLPGGVYYYRLTSGTTSLTRKMVLSH
jgi:hypothetical protein